MSEAVAEAVMPEAKERVPSDEELFEAFRFKGDRGAMDLLIERYQRLLFEYLLRFCGNSHDAEDIYQDTMVKVCCKADQFEAGREFRPWLYSIATNTAIDAMRKARRHQVASLQNVSDTEDESPYQNIMQDSRAKEPWQIIVNEEERSRIRSTVNRLPDLYRQAINMHYYGDMQYEDISGRLEIPLGTVKSRIHAAKKKMKRALCRPQKDQAEAAASEATLMSERRLVS